jgi:hypothetical protein
LLKYRAEAEGQPWPEFAEYDCRGCHHDLRQPRGGNPARFRALPPWNPWYSQRLPEALAQVGPVGAAVPAGLDNLRAMMEGPNPDRVLVVARASDLAKRLEQGISRHRKATDALGARRP